jgi:hypothetical protein
LLYAFEREVCMLGVVGDLAVGFVLALELLAQALQALDA